MTTEIIDAEVTSREIVASEPVTPALFGTTDPVEIVAKARDVANALKDVIQSQGLISNIQGREYVRCEGWTLLGSMLGIFPVNVWTREVDNGWEARVEARTMSGAVVGAAEAQCTRDENTWSKRDPYALRSMAQTRATSKALRMPLGFVVTLAGFQATPAEEMDFSARESHVTPVKQAKPPSCPDHGMRTMKYIPGGKNAKGEYGAFWKCEAKGCNIGRGNKGWSIFDDNWKAIQAAENNTEPAQTHDEAFADMPDE